VIAPVRNMPKLPQIALLVSSFQRPGHLVRALVSIALQEGLSAEDLEVVVTDDGSADETPRVVEQFARTVAFPVRFTTHAHAGFQLAKCRNEGVAASTAPYLLFLDGDCVLPRQHVAIHLRHRRPGVAMAGDRVRLDEESSAHITEEAIRSGPLRVAVPWHEHRRLARLIINSWWYRLIGHPTKPKLVGNNIGVWRSDYERVNGYDENFVGWGCEDDDLRLRLRAAGVKIRSILPWTHTYHLWHAPDPSYPQKWREGVNVPYFSRSHRATRCAMGLAKGVS
jgi:glycosyltransferase involved in cell wall biosynthesis